MARDLWARVDRPNVMIKIPGTPEGVPAIRAAIAEGININVTLLFSLDAWAAIAEAWLAGLEDRAAARQAGRRDRVGRLVLRLARRHRRRQAPEGARQSGAVRHGRGRQRAARLRALAASWSAASASPRCAAQGARPQRLLWASTGTKDPAYSDVKYVAELAGPETVNTMPLATLLAYQDHGEVARAAAAGRRARRARGDRRASRPPASRWTRSPTSCWRRGSSSSRTRWTRCSPASSGAAPPCSPASRRASRRG